MKRLIHIICIAVMVLLCTNSISLDAVGTFNIHYEHKDKDCGCASILYFENPEQTIQLQSYGASLTISE